MGFYAGPKASHLCSHARFDLRGCNRLAGHEGLHFNIFSKDDQHWSDADGKYCETQAEWSALVDNLKGSNGKYRY